MSEHPLKVLASIYVAATVLGLLVNNFSPTLCSRIFMPLMALSGLGFVLGLIWWFPTP